MNISSAIFHPPFPVRRRGRAAFSLPELFISMSIFVLLMLGVVGSTLFGMRWFQLSQTKLLATTGARQAIGKMTDEIRSCNSSFIGYVNTNGIFLGRTNGEPQVGSSLLIYPTASTNNYILYFRNAADQTFRRTCLGSGLTTIVAQTVINTNIFQVQDYLGNLQTNNINNRVVHCLLQFYQAAPNTPVPDSYTLDLAVTRRSL